MRLYSMHFMSAHKLLTHSLRSVVQVAGDLLYFPVWWYSVGLFRAARWVWFFWLGQERALGLSVWAKNIFVPMYGQRDFVGRAISFVMRLVQIVIRSAALMFWLLVCLIILLAWLAVPLALLIALAFQLAPAAPL